ncbi:nucleosidase [Gloeobacter kilaueensis]|uniref:Nucleosidase n=1 Tax=Gloeobacter kilaueensis (strain ATCC BAA-2537 / CCAP 1431/1 / ULC 316 / JS1) TaxID=1183438 RepID=U5QNF7_GLOK1|nr:nucleosidase [Gloeobacter kilaueensis]AGY59210.1 nucleosidase [Gloeobacter kilaueensis JS1]
MPIDAVLVPRGAEYQVVRQGFGGGGTRARIVAIPAGLAAGAFLETLPYRSWQRVWVLGLCGSMSRYLPVGTIVIYRHCRQLGAPEALLACDRQPIQLLQAYLPEAKLVGALTSDRVITAAREKRRLAEAYQAQVVDMEGFALLQVLAAAGVEVGMVRVVSDGSDHDLPAIGATIADGAIQPLPLALALLKDPLAATRLVGGSLQALGVLKEISVRLYATNQTPPDR